MLLALLSGIGLGLAGALFRENHDRTVRDAGETERAARVKVIGEIPRVSSALRLRSGGPAAPMALDAPDSEAFRSLRTMLQFMRDDGPQVLLVTSALPGEGKSTIAANLARVIAQKGANVCLVDADLRRGSVHAMFGFPGRPGLSDCLAGDVPLEDLIVPTAELGLSVVTRGTIVRNPAELLDTRSGAIYKRNDTSSRWDIQIRPLDQE